LPLATANFTAVSAPGSTRRGTFHSEQQPVEHDPPEDEFDAGAAALKVESFLSGRPSPQAGHRGAGAEAVRDRWLKRWRHFLHSYS